MCGKSNLLRFQRTPTTDFFEEKNINNMNNKLDMDIVQNIVNWICDYDKSCRVIITNYHISFILCYLMLENIHQTLIFIHVTHVWTTLNCYVIPC